MEPLLQDHSSNDDDDWDYGEEEMKDPGATTMLRKMSSIGTGIFNTRENNVTRSYSILTKEQVLQDRQSRIQDLCTCTGLSAGLSASLLLNYKWMVQKTIDAFTGDYDLLFKLFDYDGQQQADPTVCPSCCEESSEWIHNDDCGHCLCKDCYQQYLEFQLAKGVEVVKTPCPGGCKLPVSESVFKSLLSPHKFEKY
jgi:hypothetical protein